VIRTFVAFPLSPAWAAYASGVTALLASNVRGVSWVRPENLHLTIRFLGDLGESGVARLGDAVARAAEGLAAPTVSIGGLGTFPSVAKPRVVWLGVSEGSEALVAVGSAINAAIDRAGFDRADKPFRPHMTLGRVRPAASGLEGIRALALPPAPAQAAFDRIVVMKSDLDPSGARYTALREVRLPPP
jgi:2'-5' RNA ligase